MFQARVEVDVVEDADADDRVELASFETFAGLDVADDDLGAIADASRQRATLASLMSTATSSQPRLDEPRR